MDKIKLVYIVSNVKKSFGLEWTAARLKEKYDLLFILLNPGESPFEDFLVSEKIKVKRITYQGKPDLPVALMKVFFLLRSEHPSIVHAHLFDAQLIGLTAAKLAGVQKRIYTRHNSNFHHAYHPSGVKYDRWSNALATRIVSISQATDKILMDSEKVSPEKIVRIPHGFDFNEFVNVDEERIARIRIKWKIPTSGIIIGVIARQIEWKGIQFILPAFENFLKKYPSARLVLANAAGPYHDVIQKKIDQIGADKFVIIPFEEDVAALYHQFDMYVHTPVDEFCEAFGQTYIEALASQIPSVFTRSGIAAEFIEDRRNALVAEFKNSNSILAALTELHENPDLKERLIKIGKHDVISRFGIETMLDSLMKLYDPPAVL